MRFIDMVIHHIDMVIPGYRYGIWDIDMGDDSIDMDIWAYSKVLLAEGES